MKNIIKHFQAGAKQAESDLELAQTQHRHLMQQQKDGHTTKHGEVSAPAHHSQTENGASAATVLQQDRHQMAKQLADLKCKLANLECKHNWSARIADTPRTLVCS